MYDKHFTIELHHRTSASLSTRSAPPDAHAAIILATSRSSPSHIMVHSRPASKETALQLPSLLASSLTQRAAHRVGLSDTEEEGTDVLQMRNNVVLTYGTFQ